MTPKHSSKAEEPTQEIPESGTGSASVITVADSEKYALTPFTKVFIALGIAIGAAAIIVAITFLSVSLYHERAENADLRQRNSALLQNYVNLTKEFEDTTGKKPDAPSPNEIQKIAGPTGATGAQGAAGASGVQGVPGAQGSRGASGAQGQDGAAGENGASGQNGANGTNGQDGAQGAAGVDGANGTNGQDGADGAQGPQGPKGDKGDPGAPGADGADGAQGSVGPAGPAGPAGETCPGGTSFQPVTVTTLLEGTQTFYACR